MRPELQTTQVLSLTNGPQGEDDGGKTMRYLSVRAWHGGQRWHHGGRIRGYFGARTSESPFSSSERVEC